MLSDIFINFSRVSYAAARRSFCSSMTQKTALLLIADGSEEMEAVITADILRRAGVALTIASVADNHCVKCSRDVKVCADATLAEATDNNQKYDVVILPGGLKGSNTFATSTNVGKLLEEQEKENRIIAAICAAPIALKAHGIALKKQITSYPSMKPQLVDAYVYLEDRVVTDGTLITSRGPGTSFDFGLAIVEKLLNKEASSEVAKGMLYVSPV